jgi:hypothetical protein
MTRVMKGTAKKGGRPKLVCTRAKAGAATHPYKAVDLTLIETAFVDQWQTLLVEVPAGERGGTLDADCAALEGEIAGTEDRLERLVDAMERAPSHALAATIRGVEAQLEAVRQALAETEERRAVVDGGLIHTRLSALAEVIEAEPLSKAAVNAALRSLFDGVEVDHLSGRLRFRWKQGGVTEFLYEWRDAV